ncbi:DUF4248 domain-containing protein [Bacteroides sp. 519]|uniref:DUF4248 domain-containing protein n=1 Tax=Bacteroides sp. 519 TaxID=2302937 RepID=UPI0013D86964|nr:DUF4248 domain-containing protein [Bacteroides sp. 519]NDV57669.1 DUF4248 domain-containing protein [Bacteroides sp. 519]
MEELTVNRPFVCKSYSKKELAQLYLPYNAESTAMKKFNSWLQESPQLWSRLQEAGVGPCTRYYTATQVQLIVSYLGEPG